MRIRRLGWAGLEVEAAGETAVIDLLNDLSGIEGILGEPREPFLPVGNEHGVRLALVTHLHPDHTDPHTLAKVLSPEGVVLRPAPATGSPLLTEWAETGLRENNIPTQILAPWESVTSGPFTATAVPAVDGFGDPQVSWVLEAEGHRIIHCGDTIFHGFWWEIASRTGPFDAAFFPINGAVCNIPAAQPPSPIRADMNPSDAAVAATILNPARAVPIHYEDWPSIPAYRQADDPAASFAAAARNAGLHPQILAIGDVLDLSKEPAA